MPWSPESRIHRETCTSGSERGCGRPMVVRPHGARSLLYSFFREYIQLSTVVGVTNSLRQSAFSRPLGACLVGPVLNTNWFSHMEGATQGEQAPLPGGCCLTHFRLRHFPFKSVKNEAFYFAPKGHGIGGGLAGQLRIFIEGLSSQTSGQFDSVFTCR